MRPKTSTSLSDTVPATYDNLMALHTIRPIHDEIEYENAVKMADRLAGLKTMTQDQQDYFDLLTDQIEKYDDAHYELDTSKLNPLDTLKFLTEQNNINASALGSLLGHRQLGSAILRGERELSKNHIRILSKHFRVSADVFL
ncbi:MAG: transcriptional regulator [bacterium]